MNGASGAIGNDASGRWSKSCSVWPALWTRTIAWGVAPWISASVTDEYAGWSSEPWPSTITQSPRRSPSSTIHSTVPWAKSLMSRSTATPQPSIIIPVWPVGTNDAERPAACAEDAQLQGDRHLADRAVRADGQDHPLARAVAAPDGRLHPIRRPPVVDDPRPGSGRRSGELGVVAEERVEPGMDVEAGPDRVEDRRPPRVRELAAGRGDADQQRVRRRPSARGPPPSDATIGMSWPGRIADTLPPAWVESMTATTSSGP